MNIKERLREALPGLDRMETISEFELCRDALRAIENLESIVMVLQSTWTTELSRRQSTEQARREAEYLLLGRSDPFGDGM